MRSESKKNAEQLLFTTVVNRRLEEAEAFVALPDCAHATETRSGVRQCGFAMVLDHDAGAGARKPDAEEDLDQVAIGPPIVWRVQKNDISSKPFAGERTQHGESIALENAIIGGYSAQADVAANQAHGFLV